MNPHVAKRCVQNVCTDRDVLLNGGFHRHMFLGLSKTKSQERSVTELSIVNNCRNLVPRKSVKIQINLKEANIPRVQGRKL